MVPAIERRQILMAMLPISLRTLKASRTEFHALSNRGTPVPWEPRTLGEHFRKRRIQLGLNQAEAARRLGVSSAALGRWERGKAGPGFCQDNAIIAYLGYDPFKEVSGTPCEIGNSNETTDVAFLIDQGGDMFGKKLKKIRLNRRLTVEKCAAILAVGVTSIHRWEAGKKHPSRAHQKTIQKWFSQS